MVIIHPYVVPFLRYSETLVENREFYLSYTHVVPHMGGGSIGISHISLVCQNYSP